MSFLNPNRTTVHSEQESGGSAFHLIETRAVGEGPAADPRPFLTLVVFELPNGQGILHSAEKTRVPTAVIPVKIGVTTKKDFLKAIANAANRLDTQIRYPSYAAYAGELTVPDHLCLSIEPADDNVSILWHMFPSGSAPNNLGSTYLDTVDDEGFWNCVKKIQNREHYGVGQDYFSCEVKWTLYEKNIYGGKTVIGSTAPVGRTISSLLNRPATAAGDTASNINIGHSSTTAASEVPGGTTSEASASSSEEKTTSAEATPKASRLFATVSKAPNLGPVGAALRPKRAGTTLRRVSTGLGVPEDPSSKKLPVEQTNKLQQAMPSSRLPRLSRSPQPKHEEDDNDEAVEAAHSFVASLPGVSAYMRYAASPRTAGSKRAAASTSSSARPTAIGKTSTAFSPRPEDDVFAPDFKFRGRGLDAGSAVARTKKAAIVSSDPGASPANADKEEGGARLR